MPFSHHSHSGEFCAHASNSLEEMVQAAIDRQMRVYALTEHMPRDERADLYPEENDIPGLDLSARFTAFVSEARRLQSKYSNQITLLVGMETEWIRDSTLPLIRTLQEQQQSEYGNPFDLVVGSVHHVHTIPIDFSRELWLEARDRSGGTDAALYAAYLDAQLEMLKAVQPAVVGHFDVVRLFGPDGGLRTGLEQPPAKPKDDDSQESTNREIRRVWDRVLRNLTFIKSYGGFLELNSSALRKGLREPYPAADVCAAWLDMGGRFVLSDDAHAVGQVATCYDALLGFIERVGITELHYLTRGLQDAHEDRDATRRDASTLREGIVVESVSVRDVRAMVELWASSLRN
ncbi:MAG: hypothetical protein M1825_005997 [Sarcosagium campestre]|nr:MAG: hypothetical protein M1825_005997 [Sarcosagium campestre]